MSNYYIGKIDNFSKFKKDIFNWIEANPKNKMLVPYPRARLSDVNYSMTDASYYGFGNPNNTSAEQIQHLAALVYPYISQLVTIDNQQIHAEINVYEPGQFIPPHTDQYKQFCLYYNIDPLSLDYQNVRRYIIHLTTPIIGQFLQIEDTVISSYNKGDVFCIPPKATHVAGNMGIIERVSLTITCKLLDKDK